MKKFAKWAAVVLAIAFLVIQVVPVERDNPPVQGDVPASPEVRAVLRRACYDCHSNETRWPWYSQIAPVSWLVANDVREGRRSLNFSTWSRLARRDQSEVMHESWEKVSEGEMPPSNYLLTHPDARLSDEDRRLLQQWSQSASNGGRRDESEEGRDED